MSRLRITWVKSAIGYNRVQRRTITAMGFHRLQQTVEHEDNASVRGMIAKVRHLVRLEEEAPDETA
ncbi:MAG: 50S ribosomal protein L30 [Dehalococcoidia bacterium]